MPLETPVFKPHVHVHLIPGEGVLFLTDHVAKVLRGAAYQHIVPLIDGRRSVDDIVDALAEQMNAVTVLHALARMQASGSLCEATPDIPARVAAFWHQMGVEPVEALRALQHRRVSVLAVGEVDPAGVESALHTAGVRLGTEDDADLWVVASDDYLRPELEAINRSAIRANRPWLLHRGSGRELWIGPLFLPGETACWECLHKRLERHKAVHRFVASTTSDGALPITAVGALAATQVVACHLAAVAAAQFLAGGDRDLAGRVLSFDWATHASQRHVLVRDPHCSACGTAPRAVVQPVLLQPRRATCSGDGGLRTVPPETTLSRYEHLVSPITGIVGSLAPASSHDEIARVYVAGHGTASTASRLDALEQGLRESSSGKGLSDTQAKVSALCEAIERYSGELTGGEARVTCAWRDWGDGDAYRPNDVMLFSARQYAERATRNTSQARINQVPEPLADDQPIDWTPVWSLTEQRHKFLPTQLVYYRAQARQGDPTSYALGCSNGNAAGNTLEDAILHGLLELVERDAAAVWWYNRLSRPGVSIESFGDPSLLELQEEYRRRRRRDTWALDVTGDLGIPVFLAVSKMLQGSKEQLLFGLGCDLDPHVALRRAFGELHQMVVIADEGRHEGRSAENGERFDWLCSATVANQPYLAPDTTQALRHSRDFATPHHDDLLEAVNDCRNRIEPLGMEVLVLDQTRADVGMPVVKVVVPGLRHFWARFGPGRLYDVPVTMHWLERPRREDELNPIPMFI